MRKQIIGDDEARDSNGPWIDLESLAQVVLTSEDNDHPIEAAFTGTGSGWRAARQGDQVIRLLFDKPLSLHRIWVGFEDSTPRTQEFVLRWSPDFGRSHREVVRQQYTFSAGTMREVEDYAVDLNEVTQLELRITPDVHYGTAHASLKELRLA